jgi:hypothetical protein
MVIIGYLSPLIGVGSSWSITRSFLVLHRQVAFPVVELTVGFIFVSPYAS